jgi:hypothetical protein
MSRKSRSRMMAGRTEGRTGETRYGPALKAPALGNFRPLTPKKRAAMLEYLAATPEGEREGVREYLRQDGSEKALALLEELEREWEGEQWARRP